MHRLCPQFVTTSMHANDIIIKGRNKRTQTPGTSIRVRFVPRRDSPFTGIFKTGSEYGLMHFSLAQTPVENTCIPHMTWKTLVDGRLSVNIMALKFLYSSGGV